jgi:hypothetical protein
MGIRKDLDNMKNNWATIKAQKEALAATRGKPRGERQAALSAVRQDDSSRRLEAQAEHYERRAAKMSRKTFGGGWRAAKAAQRAQALREQIKD